MTLPSAVGIAGKRYVIRKSDASANTVTIDPAGAETVNGSATRVISTQYEAVEIVSDGAGWVTT